MPDPASEPHVTADELSEAFGVAKSTMGSKARQVRYLLRISPFSPEFSRADVAAQNPLMWIIEVNGLAVDARHVPVDIQVGAFERGFRRWAVDAASLASSAANLSPYWIKAAPHGGAVGPASAPRALALEARPGRTPGRPPAAR